MADDIQRSLGRIEQKVDSLISSVKETNDANTTHFTLLDKKVDILETFRDNLQGRMGLLGAMAGFIGGLITILFNKFLFKK